MIKGNSNLITFYRAYLQKKVLHIIFMKPTPMIKNVHLSFFHNKEHNSILNFSYHFGMHETFK